MPPAEPAMISQKALIFAASAALARNISLHVCKLFMPYETRKDQCLACSELLSVCGKL